MVEPKNRNPILLSALMEKANQDPLLRARFLTEPEKVAEEFKISLEARELDYLKKVGELFRLSDELRAIHFGPGPIFYPVDFWWGRKLIELLSKVRVIPIPKPGYPIDFQRIREILRPEILGAETMPGKTQF